MKGNEARVVFFLHPVDQLKDGQVSKMKPLRSSFGVFAILLLGLLLGLGVLVYLLLPFGVQTSQQRSVSDGTTQPTIYKYELNDLYDLNDTNNESVVTERTTEVTRENESTTEAEAKNDTTSPGMYTSILCHEST